MDLQQLKIHLEEDERRLQTAKAQIPQQGRLPATSPELHHELRVMAASQNGHLKFDHVLDKQCKDLDTKCLQVGKDLKGVKMSMAVLTKLDAAAKADSTELLRAACTRKYDQMEESRKVFATTCEEIVIKCFELRERFIQAREEAAAVAAKTPKVKATPKQTPKATPPPPEEVEEPEEALEPIRKIRRKKHRAGE